jgi:hypothetical protein
MTEGSDEAREAALRRIADLEQQAERVVAAFEAAMAADDPDQQLEASETLLAVNRALLRAYADAGRWDETDELAMTPGEAAMRLLKDRQAITALIPGALRTSLEIAVSSDDSEARQGAREDLVDGGWLTTHEIETFPEASLHAIVLERFWQRAEDI